MKSANTETTVIGHRSNDESFADVRKRAILDEKEHYKKAHRDKTVKVPKFKIGELVVCTTQRTKNRCYYLLEVVDTKESRYGGFKYFGILRKTTDKDFVNRINHLEIFTETDSGWTLDFIPANIVENSINWLLIG